MFSQLADLGAKTKRSAKAKAWSAGNFSTINWQNLQNSYLRRKRTEYYGI